jgi:hypothetical protein
MQLGKRRLVTIMTTAALFFTGLLNMSPGQAAVTQPAAVSQNKCSHDVCMQVSRNTSTGKTIYSAEVQWTEGAQGEVVSIYYVGYGANGSLKGPQHHKTVTCNPICAAKWTINYTYSSGDFIFGYVTISGTSIPGVPTYSF